MYDGKVCISGAANGLGNSIAIRLLLSPSSLRQILKYILCACLPTYLHMQVGRQVGWQYLRSLCCYSFQYGSSGFSWWPEERTSSQTVLEYISGYLYVHINKLHTIATSMTTQIPTYLGRQVASIISGSYIHGPYCCLFLKKEINYLRGHSRRYIHLTYT